VWSHTSQPSQWASERRTRGEDGVTSSDGRTALPELVCHVTGARPNFPKAAPVIAALRERGIGQRLVHTGQHYDDNMSTVFFRQLDLPLPDVNLAVGSGSHAQQTAAIMTSIEEEFLRTPPALVMVYGDVNSTVAAALVGAKLGIPVAHVEAGLRSFDRSMPEEVNRVVTDQLSDLLFVTSPEAIGHLSREGVAQERIHFVGNPMIDTLLKHLDATGRGTAQQRHDLPQPYAVATLHRPGNVDSTESLLELVKALHQVADDVPIVLPVHPRGRAAMEAAGLFEHVNVRCLEPLGYLDFIGLVRDSAFVLTDSGGVQEETTVLGVPCFTLRPNTERPVTITHGTNRLVKTPMLPNAVREMQQSQDEERAQRVPPLWDGRAGERIAAVVEAHLERP
jgi:UDP-N-acetylglucosamine 2-epimerase (non-hydrolysing)